MYSYRVERRLKTPPDIAWAIISDVEGYARYAPNLSKTYLVGSQRGVGMRRHVVDVAGKTWEEVCVLWEEGSRYTMEARDYPYAMRIMRGTWGVDPTDDGVIVYMQFDYQPRFDLPLIGRFLDRRSIRPTLEQVSQQLLDNWEREIHNRAGY